MTDWRSILILVCVVLLVGSPVYSLAQSDAAAKQALAGEVQITVDRFGVGGVVRPGSYAGIRLALTDSGPRVRPVLVRIHTIDPDGDTVLNERVVTLNPGTTQGVWIYVNLPFTFSSNSILTVTAHEVASDNAPGQLPNPGRQVGIARIKPAQEKDVVDSADAMIGVIGRSRFGLEQYEAKYQNSRNPPTGLEWQRIVSIDPNQLAARIPDSPLGLSAFDVLVWGEGDPNSLRLDSTDAIRQWVYSGGHLVIILPPVGGTWLSAVDNPLFDLLPNVTVTRRERADLNRYRGLLTSSPTVSLPRESVLHTFALRNTDPNALFLDSTIILSGPDGQGVVARRLLGAGAVTLIGIDLRNRNLVLRLSAQRFWHRVLGHRFDVLTSAQMTSLRDRKENPADFTFRENVSLDTDFSSIVDRTGRSGVGVMIGLTLCTFYLLLAGPIGYGLLKKWKIQRHAWSAFLGTSLLFTIIAWVSTTSAKPRTESMQSIVMLDAVYGQKIQRARAWVNVLLPTYGTQLVSIADGPDAATFWSALTAWDSPGFLSQNRFPDARGYRVDTKSHTALNVPTRSTVKMFQADWSGSTSLGLPNMQGGRIQRNAQGTLDGILTHNLPTALENGTIAFIERQADLIDLGPGSVLPVHVQFWALTGPWEPGAPLDLNQSTSAKVLSRNDSYLENLTKTTSFYKSGVTGAGLPKIHFMKRLEMLTWYPMLKQPEYLRLGTNQGAFNKILKRHATHSLDLGRWFTQPCVIITGELPDVKSPVPILVDNREVESSARVFLRWVYPLPSNPPRFALQGSN